MSPLVLFMLRRTLLVLPVLLMVTFIAFILIHLAPGSPVELIVGDDPRVSEEDIQRLRASLGLDQPVHVQFVRFVGNAARGDLGHSFHTGQQVSVMIVNRVPYTLELGVASLLLSLIIAVTVGVLSALRRNTWVDDLSMLGALLGVSMPNFWLGLLLMLVFSVKLGWLPATGAGTKLHLILPTIALGAVWAALSTRLVRSSMLEVLGEDYVRTARSKGLGERTVIYKHTLRNALIPVVTYVGTLVPAIVGGAVITETIFARPGIGRLLVDSIARRDFPVVQGVLLMVGISVTLVNLVVDILYTILDPRIRYE